MKDAESDDEAGEWRFRKEQNDLRYLVKTIQTELANIYQRSTFDSTTQVALKKVESLVDKLSNILRLGV